MANGSEPPMAGTTDPARAGDTAAPDEDLIRSCAIVAERYTRWLLGESSETEQQASGTREPASRKSRRPAAKATANQTCGAHLRDGSLCQRPPVEGRRRCRSHGCAPRTGAPHGNRNALKHGCFTAVEMARRRRINDFFRECNATLKELDATMKDEVTNAT